MSERQVLAKGGVISYKIPLGSSLSTECISRLDSGIGRFREEGLGRILVNPAFLVNPPRLEEIKPELEHDIPVSLTNPGTPLIAYLQAKSARQILSVQAFNQGKAWAKEWLDVEREAARLKVKRPAKSQWSNLREIAVGHLSSPSHLATKLREYFGASLRKRVWVESKVRWHAKDTNFSELVQNKLAGPVGVMECLTLIHAAVEMGKKNKRDKGTRHE
jgi:hypothetical protein